MAVCYLMLWNGYGPLSCKSNGARNHTPHRYRKLSLVEITVDQYNSNSIPSEVMLIDNVKI